MRLLAALALLGIACQSQGGPPAQVPAPPPARVTDVTAKDYPMPALPRARVTLTDAWGYKHLVDVEVATTGPARTRGMMWRTALAEGAGMLFIFPDEEPLSFWMKNTLIPLDMIFISRARVIVGIVERAAPRTLETRGPQTPALYVLEVPAGWASKIGLRPGLQVQLDGLRDLVVTD